MPNNSTEVGVHIIALFSITCSSLSPDPLVKPQYITADVSKNQSEASTSAFTPAPGHAALQALGPLCRAPGTAQPRAALRGHRLQLRNPDLNLLLLQGTPKSLFLKTLTLPAIS